MGMTYDTGRPGEGGWLKPFPLCGRPRVKRFWGILAALFLFQSAGGGAELFRLRLSNTKGGPVQVSTDRGGRWVTIGRVLRGAFKPGPLGGGGRPGQVVRATRGGLWLAFSGRAGIKVVPAPSGVLSRVGVECLVVDLSAGIGLFGNLAPLVGSAVLVEGSDGRVRPVSAGYRPRSRDRFVLVVAPPALWKELTFENWTGGQVRGVTVEGREVLAGTVRRPLLGVGMVEGTREAGVGRVVAVGMGGMAISTVAGGHLSGGFEVVDTSGEGVSGPMVIESPVPLWPSIGLWSDPASGVDIKIDNGAWEPLPEMPAPGAHALTAEGLRASFAKGASRREVSSGMTHLRIRFPAVGASWLSDQIARLGRPALSGKGRREVYSGVMAVKALLRNAPNIRYVTFSVDGKLRAMVDSEPFQFDWDTTEVADGPHTLEVKGLDRAGTIITAQKTVIWVQNGSSSR